VWLAVGRTDMRKGVTGPAVQVQERLKRDPHTGEFLMPDCVGGAFDAA
jgi:transposase